ncbi:MAG: nucleotidyltransferase domain-containing protein [Candidatus Electrothrix sp. AR3]|nr:nucleotidyltransferase domain-containing protein [Candidatus Electrothrix sp. AR3]
MTETLFLREKDRLRILDLLHQHLPEVTAWAYGSRVNGDAHDGSDLDIVLRSPDLSPIPLGDLQDFVEALRESNIPILVEARDWARLPEYFHGEILRGYVVLAGDSGNFSKGLKNKSPVFDRCCRGRPLCLPGMQGRTQGFAPTVPGITGKIFLIKFLTASMYCTMLKWDVTIAPFRWGSLFVGYP